MSRGLVHRVLLGASVAVVNVVVRATAALAQSYPGGGQSPTPSPQVSGEQFFRGNSGNPANPALTGTDIILFLIIAILALAIGLLLRRASQRRSAGAAE